MKMNTHKGTVIACTVAAILAFGASHEASAVIPCRTYDVKDGLSENSVRYILQDSKGYMWFGTKDGLSRYNGKEFRIYGSSSDTPRQLNIEYLTEHKDGDKIWIASRYSLELLDVASGMLTELPLAEYGIDKNLRAMCYDRDGRLWIGGNDCIAVVDVCSSSDAADYRVIKTIRNRIGSNGGNSNEENSSRGGNSNGGNINGGSGDGILPDGNIETLLCDRNGNIWIGTENGLARYDRKSGKVIKINVSGGKAIHPLCLSEDENGIIWTGTWDDGIYSINPTDGSSHNYLSPHGNSSSASSDYRLTSDGLPHDGDASQGITSDSRKNGVPIIRCLYHNGKSSIIVCSNSGLFEYDKSNGTLRRMRLSEGLSNDSFYCCTKDHEGGLWVGTYFNGAFYISPKAAKIEIYRPEPHSLFSGTAVSEFCSCSENLLWVGTENGGLSLLDRQKERFVPIRWHDKNENIHAICQRGDDLWVATFSTGLKRINLKTGSVRYYYLTPDNTHESENAVYSLYFSHIDGHDMIYAGVKKGCYVYDYGSDSVYPIPELEGYTVYDIYEDYTGKQWFSCSGYGLYCHDKSTGLWKFYRNDPDDPTSLCSDRIIDIYGDSDGQLWLCSEGNGVCRYDYGSDSFDVPRVNTPDGKLPSNVIFGILDDGNGHIWMSSNAGIIRLNPTTGDYRLYTHEDGLQSNQFNFKSFFKTDDGKFWFGGVNGFNAFYPEDLHDNSVAPRITASVTYNGYCFYGETVTIPSGVNNFTVNFDCLSYVAPQRTVFEYRFDKDEEWTETKLSSVSFADMKPGRYTLLLRAVNSDGYRSDKEFPIVIDILTPWYRSVTAICIYFFLALAAITAALIAFLRFRRKEEQRKMEDLRLRNEQESYNAKIQFFTQIAHEIKTPVTLIQAPLEIVLGHRVWDRETEENLEIIEANTKRLTELTNQLLDFKKISNEGYMLHLSETSLSTVAEDVIRRFRTPANSHISINMEVGSPAHDGGRTENDGGHIPGNARKGNDGGERFRGMFDPDAISKILSNLVENAVKFAADSITIALDAETKDGEDYVKISVTNNGPAIPENEAGKIFDTFYQVDGNRERKPGFGIGLSLVNLLVTKAGGIVYVDTAYTEGCRFCVELPWHKCEDKDSSASAGYDGLNGSDNGFDGAFSANDDNSDGNAEDNAGKLSLLIVEDNTDLLSFLAEQLEQSYNVIKATDGKKAVSKLEKQHVDIIISDIAMPKMDGFELLRYVRGNEMTSHIPFILLSAESSVESKIKGLDNGADAYIEKPFSINHFKAVIDSLVNSRRALIEKFTSSPEGSLNMSKYGSLDAEWLAKVDAIIYANLSSIGFSVQQLADEMYVSRSNLQRKLKSLTDMTPNEYIRLIRLKKAAELLLSDKYRINEVSYMCGFNTASYFTSCFFKQFGILPKEFIALHKTES